MVLEQARLFGESILLGFFISACYDIYRAIRIQKPFSYTALILGDCLFWLGLTAGCFAFFVLRSWAEIHLYTYLGLAAGAGFYFFCSSRYLLSFWNRVFGCLFGLLSPVVFYFSRLLILIFKPFYLAWRTFFRKNQY